MFLLEGRENKDCPVSISAGRAVKTKPKYISQKNENTSGHLRCGGMSISYTVGGTQHVITIM